jgi:tetratricopeptide (TPR) repeat protein
MPAARPDPDALWSQYQQLPPGPKLILRLQSLVLFPTPKQVCLECLTQNGLKMPDGRAWSLATVKSALDSLVRGGLVTDQLLVPPALLHQVTEDAVAGPEGAALIAAVRKTFSTHNVSRVYYYKPDLIAEAFGRLIRLAVYMNDEPGFAEQCAAFDRALAPLHASDLLAAVFGRVPLATDWFANRAPALQDALLQSKLTALRDTGVATPELPGLLEAYRAQPARAPSAAVLRAIAGHDLLAGRIGAVRTAIQYIKDAGWEVERQSLSAAVAFLEGRNDDALALYRDALKLLRKRIGKRKIFLDGEHGVFFILALLRANDAGLHAEIEAGLEIVLCAPTHGTVAFFALRGLLHLVQGQHDAALDMIGQLKGLKQSSPLEMAVVALAQYTIDPAASRTQEAPLAAEFGRMKHSLKLIACIHAEILAAVSSQPAPYAAFLAADGKSISIAFTGIVQARQPWEWVLESLGAALGANAAKAEAVRKARRLAWFVNPDTLSIDVAEQSAKGKDGWSDGRPVALKRLRDRDPRLDYLTEQDRAVLPFITDRSGPWGVESYDFDPIRALPALAGHPSVFDARRRSQQIELVSYPLELVIAERGDGYHVALSHSADKPAVFLEPETPSRLRVIVLPERLLSLQAMLGENGLTVPGSARDRLVALVQRDNPTLPIRDEIGAVTAAAEMGLSAPVVQLTPFAEGLKVALLVRVFGPDGPAYVAGLGGRSVLATLHDEKRRAIRDLQRERDERDALVAACPTLRDRGGADAHDLVIEDLDGCLELLLELQAYPGPVSVEWPAGRTMQVTAVTPDKLTMRVTRDRDWFNVDGTIALEDDQVLEMRFLLDRLDRAQGRFVALGDGRFIALTRHLQAQMQRLAAVSDSGRAGRRVHALGAPALEGVLAEAGSVKVDAAWKQHIGRIRGRLRIRVKSGHKA